MKDITIDLSLLFLILLLIVLLIIFVLTHQKVEEKIYKAKAKKAKDYGGKGILGEFLVKDVLDDICFYKGGYNYQGLKLEDEYGNWTEIDNIYISAYGVFLIETKYVAGRITGEPTAKNWKQHFGKGKSKEFRNPLIQNKRHITFFQRVFPDVFNVTPLVVFVDPVNIKDLPYMNGVIKLCKLENYIDSCKRIYRDSKVEEINREVKQFVDNPPFTHEEYASWVRETYYSK